VTEQLQAAQEREKALREAWLAWQEQTRLSPVGDDLREKSWRDFCEQMDALAASPSEKPGSEDYPKRHPNEAVEAAGRRASRRLGRIERQEREDSDAD
jgi:hypothetical protein